MGGIPVWDLMALLLLLLSLLLGAWRGIVFELAALAGWVVAFVLARWAAPLAADWLARWIQLDEHMQHGLGFAAVFVLMALLMSALASALRSGIKAVGARSADRVLGAAFGVLRGGLLLLALALALALLQLNQAPWWTESRSGPWLEKGLGLLQLLWPLPLAWWPVA